jgi:hypothetical protein
MPATSKAQAVMMAIAEHAPGKLYARNKGALQMTKSQLHDFAATKRKGLPARAKSRKGATGKLGQMLGK